MTEPLGKDGFIWGLGALCQLHRIPFDEELILKSFPPPYDLTSFQLAASKLGFKIAVQDVDLIDIHPSSLPVLGLQSLARQPTSPTDASQLISEATPNTLSEAPDYQFILILKADHERALCIGQGESAPRALPLTELATQLTGRFVFTIPQHEMVNEEGGSVKASANAATQQKTKFGFRWFIPELLKHRSIWKEVLLASFAIQLVSLATPLCTQVVIDKVVVHHTTSTLIVIAVALGIFLIFNAAMSWVRQYLVIHTGNRMDAVLGYKVFSHLLHLPMRYFEHRPTGVLVARLHGVETIREFLAGSLTTLVLDLPFLIVFLAIMFWYSWQLSLIAVTSLALITMLSLIVTPIFRKKLNHQFLLGARNQAFVTEYISGMETVKSLQLEPQLEKRYGDYLSSYLDSTFDTKKLSNSYNTAANTLDQLQTLCILCAGAWIVMHNPEFTIGMLVAFQMFSSRLSGPVLRLVGMYQEFQQADIAVKRLGDLMDAPVEPYSLVPSRNMQPKGEIEFANVSFRYSENHPWLYQNLNLKIAANQCTVIMGPSGSGKSTLTKLLLGFLQPEEGVIKIDGKDIRYLSANELRNYFGVVPQETTLFSGTLYDNFTLANPNASFQDIAYACTLAGIHEVIENLPGGYTTEIGEGGTGLSGGQKQRVAIARALVKKPSILIFDEAIANLDEHSSEELAKIINAIKNNISVIFITHKLPKSLTIDSLIELSHVNSTHKVTVNTSIK